MDAENETPSPSSQGAAGTPFTAHRQSNETSSLLIDQLFRNPVQAPHQDPLQHLVQHPPQRPLRPPLRQPHSSGGTVEPHGPTQPRTGFPNNGYQSVRPPATSGRSFLDPPQKRHFGPSNVGIFPISGLPLGYQARPAGSQALPLNYQVLYPGYHVPPATYQILPATYRIPPASYLVPPSSYQTPPASYQVPLSGYEAPPFGYQTPSSHTQARSPRHHVQSSIQSALLHQQRPNGLPNNTGDHLWPPHVCVNPDQTIHAFPPATPAPAGHDSGYRMDEQLTAEDRDLNALLESVWQSSESIPDFHVQPRPVRSASHPVLTDNLGLSGCEPLSRSEAEATSQPEHIRTTTQPILDRHCSSSAHNVSLDSQGQTIAPANKLTAANSQEARQLNQTPKPKPKKRVRRGRSASAPAVTAQAPGPAISAPPVEMAALSPLILSSDTAIQHSPPEILTPISDAPLYHKPTPPVLQAPTPNAVTRTPPRDHAEHTVTTPTSQFHAQALTPAADNISDTQAPRVTSPSDDSIAGDATIAALATFPLPDAATRKKQELYAKRAEIARQKGKHKVNEGERRGRRIEISILSQLQRLGSQQASTPAAGPPSPTTQEILDSKADDAQIIGSLYTKYKAPVRLYNLIAGTTPYRTAYDWLISHLTRLTNAASPTHDMFVHTTSSAYIHTGTFISFVILHNAYEPQDLAGWMQTKRSCTSIGIYNPELVKDRLNEVEWRTVSPNLRGFIQESVEKGEIKLERVWREDDPGGWHERYFLCASNCKVQFPWRGAQMEKEELERCRLEVFDGEGVEEDEEWDVEEEEEDGGDGEWAPQTVEGVSVDGDRTLEEILRDIEDRKS
ncbi:hypothetical protein M011DRAFT_476938 [Sporormia fimetaria CBS 119925]|uniref:Uncharacterized protein n=1 Tax=Sporormia fimetaria CBS 119925 TaxID=1340428 RepID=A0A6A6VDG9_9PLEO|nr:hypothetical protein M011DRAFT_476938 [Sporormia fimetaria CBS 119925]